MRRFTTEITAVFVCGETHLAEEIGVYKMCPRLRQLRLRWMQYPSAQVEESLYPETRLLAYDIGIVCGVHKVACA